MALQNAPKQSGRVHVTVCHISPLGNFVRPARLPKGATAERAIHASGILPMCPELNLAKHKIGIYGKIVAKDTPLHDNDRIEIYLPARASGKNARQLKQS